MSKVEQFDQYIYVSSSIAELARLPNLKIGPVTMDYSRGEGLIVYSRSGDKQKYVRRCSLNPGIPTTEEKLIEGAIRYDKWEEISRNNLRHTKN